MNEKIITKELAKLYEKQGYLEESLACYSSLYEQTKEEKVADAIEKIRKKLNPVKSELINKSSNESLDKESKIHWKKSSEHKQKPSEHKTDSKEKEDTSTRVLTLFEQWVNMIVLEKKIQNFKKFK